MALALPGFPVFLPQKPHPPCRHHQQQASVNLPRRCSRFPCIHCNAQAEEDAPGASSSPPPPSHQSWVDGARGDSYAGWAFLENNGKRNKLSGFLRVGAGVALAVGFALVSHACSKRGLGTMVISAPPVYEQTFSPTIEETAKPQDSELVQEAVNKEEEHSPMDVHDPEIPEEKHVDEPVQIQDDDKTTTGQVSFQSEKNEEVSDDAVSSSTASTGAVSTLGDENYSENNAEGHAEDVPSAHSPSIESSSSTAEDSSSPAELTAEHPAELTAEDSSSPAQLPAEDSSFPTELTAEDSSSPAELATEDSSSPAELATEDSASPAELATEDSSSPGEFTTQTVSNDANSVPESSFSDPAHTPDGSRDPSEEPLKPAVMVISGIPETFLSVDGDTREVESEPKVEEAYDIVVSFSTLESENVSKVGATPVESENAADDLIAHEADNDDEINRRVVSSSESEIWHFTSLVIPAPCAPSALASGRVLIPPVVDHAQEQAVAALQSLKLVEPGVGAADICTRREYARWLVAANRTLARSTGNKVLPAMYMEKVTELAFDDVSPEDPDFPFIQGLAEAGLISSKLSQDGESKFLPDRPLSRQDLISWKLALDRHTLPVVDREKLMERTGFIDVDQIHKDAWPSIAADVSTGEGSIIASAFGYTRRFQPRKPVTTGQAAVALISGDASEQVSEELERLEAEKMAEKAVAASIAMEARAQKEANAVYHEELEHQKQLTTAAESFSESLRAELEKLKDEREGERLEVMKERASLQAAKETLSQARLEVDGLLQELSSEKVRVVFERDRLEKLLTEIEEERDSLENVKSETEVEKRALTLARTWAEEEAKKARAHAKVLEEARKRWESQGIEVHVAEDLDDSNIPAPTWQFNGEKLELDKSENTKKPPMHEIMVRADEYKGKSVKFLKEALQISNQKLSVAQKNMLKSLQEITKKADEVRQSTFFVVKKKAQEARGSAASMALGISSLVSENTHKLADGCKGSAEKLAQIFKS